MIFTTQQYWQLAIDGLQIFLCLLILFVFVVTRVRGRRPRAKSAEDEYARNFNTRVLVDSIQQQTEQAFDNILTVIANERRNLDGLLQLLAARQPVVAVSDSPVASDGDGSQKAPDHGQGALPDDQLKGEVEKLAASGLDAGQISQQLKISVGEAELISNLAKKRA